MHKTGAQCGGFVTPRLLRGDADGGPAHRHRSGAAVHDRRGGPADQAIRFRAAAWPSRRAPPRPAPPPTRRRFSPLSANTFRSPVPQNRRSVEAFVTPRLPRGDADGAPAGLQRSGAAAHDTAPSSSHAITFGAARRQPSTRARSRADNRSATRGSGRAARPVDDRCCYLFGPGLRQPVTGFQGLEGVVRGHMVRGVFGRVPAEREVMVTPDKGRGHRHIRGLPPRRQHVHAAVPIQRGGQGTRLRHAPRRTGWRRLWASRCRSGS